MPGFATIEGVSSKMKGPEKLLWYAARAAKAKSTSAASVLLSPPRPLDESAFLPLEASRAFLLLLIPLQRSGPRPPPFFSEHTATKDIYTLSLLDTLPI